MYKSRILLSILLLNLSLTCLAMEKDDTDQPEIVQKSAQKAIDLQAKLDALRARINTKVSAEDKSGECAICMNDLPGDQLNTCACASRVCNDCIREDVQQHKHHPSRIKCHCGQPRPFERVVYQQLLQTLIENFKKDINEAHPNGKSCPTPDCQHHFLDQTPKNRYHLIQYPQCNS